MKKILAISTAILMLAVMALPMFAANIEAPDLGNINFEIKKITAAWKPDGTISDGEYYKVDSKPTWYSGVSVKDENDEYATTLCPDFYMSWDETYVYFASSVTQKEVVNEYDDNPVGMWAGAAMQANYSNVDAVDEERYEFGVSRSTATGDLLTTVWGDYLSSGHALVPGEDFIVTANGNTLTYEFRTPWSAFIETPASAVAGFEFGLCFVWSVGTGDDNYIHAQLAQGCSGFGKNADMYAKAKLAAAPEVVTEAPETQPADTDAPATTTPAPQTADIFGIVALVSVLGIAGVVVASKKRG